MPFNGVTNYGLVSRKGAGRRSLEFGGRVPENEALSLEEGCRKAMLGVSRKGAGKRGLGSGGRVAENEVWSVEEGCQKARLGVWRKGAGKRGLECDAEFTVLHGNNLSFSFYKLTPCFTNQSRPVRGHINAIFLKDKTKQNVCFLK